MESESTPGTPTQMGRLMKHMFGDPVSADGGPYNTWSAPVEHVVRVAGSDFPPYLLCDCGWIDYPDTDSVVELAEIAAAHVAEGGDGGSYTVTELVPADGFTGEVMIDDGPDAPPRFVLGQTVYVEDEPGVRREVTVVAVSIDELRGGWCYKLMSIARSG